MAASFLLPRVEFLSELRRAAKRHALVALAGKTEFCLDFLDEFPRASSYIERRDIFVRMRFFQIGKLTLQ